MSLCFEVPVMLGRFAGLGLACVRPPQFADEPQNSQNTPQPERIQKSERCICFRAYHFAVELSEHVL